MPVPNFLIIGAAKSGTTSLYNYLRQHPQIFMCPEKEPNFFILEGTDLRARRQRRRARDGTEVADWPSYVKLFDGAKDQKAIGEASPGYLAASGAPDRICRYLPDAKLIAILRNPVDRAYSARIMRMRDQERAFKHADELSTELVRQGIDGFGQVLNGGFYHRHLSRYLKRFADAQIHVFLYDDLVGAKQQTLDRLTDAIGVEPFQFQPGTVYNRGGVYRSNLWQLLLAYQNPIRLAARYGLPTDFRRRLFERIRSRTLVAPPPLPDPLRSQLIAHYRDDVLKLEELIDRDLRAWLT